MEKKILHQKILNKIVDKWGAFRYNAPRRRETGRKISVFKKIEIFLLTKMGRL